MAKKQSKSRSALSLGDFYPLVFFLFFYFLFVLMFYRDYGIGWDEYTVYSRGNALLRYYLEGWKSEYFLSTSGAGDPEWALYNYGYMMMLCVLNRAFSFECFHLLNFMFASLAFAAAYLLPLHYYRNAWAGMLGPVFLFLSPRFLGYIPIDPRDAPFAVVFLIALSALFYFRNQSGWGKWLSLGFVFGAAQSLRIIGGSLYLIWFLFYLYEGFLDKGRNPLSGPLKKHAPFLRDLFLVFLLSLFFMTLTWPYLQRDFFRHFWEFLRMSAQYPLSVDFLFMGRTVSSLHLPWEYLPVWIAVSTPLFIILLLAGIPFWVPRFFQNRLLIFGLIALGVNLTLNLIFKPVLYLSMRHFLFLLPLLSLLAGVSAYELVLRAKKSIAARALVGLVALTMILTGAQLIRLHPYEYIFFNKITGGLPGAYGRFEIEERGISAKEAVEWLKANVFTDPEKTYHVSCFQDDFQTLYYLPSNVKFETDRDKADFLITLPYSGKHRFNNKLLHSIERQGVPLMDIYQR